MPARSLSILHTRTKYTTKFALCPRALSISLTQTHARAQQICNLQDVPKEALLKCLAQAVEKGEIKRQQERENAQVKIRE